MGEMTKTAVQEAHKWAKEHVAIHEVSDLQTDSDGLFLFTATFRVHLPSRFAKRGETRHGVRALEPVTFLFSPTFPYRAPILRLRDDFCRDFPHINPNETWVSPCVYEGDLSELIQQPRWFDGLLDQIADWLSKAASDDLMNMRQGWEPMRTDECHGMLIDDWETRQHVFDGADSPCLHHSSYLQNDKGEYSAIILQRVSGKLNSKTLSAGNTSVAIFLSTPLGKTVDRYLPCCISGLDDLEVLGVSFGIADFGTSLKKLRRKLEFLGRKILFVVLAVRRPVPLIGSPYAIEFLSFALRWSIQTKKKRGKTRTYRVQILSNLNRCTPALLQRFSGSVATKDRVCIIGCGSLGSKICMHLARGGQDRMLLIDNDVFMPHNNSRHTLIGQTLGYKSKCLSADLKKMGIEAEPVVGDIRTSSHAIPSNAVVIDATASVPVRNFLAKTPKGRTVINCSLYSHSRLGALCIEGPEHNPRIDDLVLSLLKSAMEEPDLKNKLLEDSLERQSTGQGCGSLSIVSPDSRISIVAAGMASRIQRHFTAASQAGEVTLGRVGESDMEISWDARPLGPTISLQDAFGEGWEVRLLDGVEAEMERTSRRDSPNETGGVLIGHVSYVNKSMTVVDLIAAPEDSVKKPGLFVLGTAGLKKAIRRIEEVSKGVFTYLGTWHSHPGGGRQSDTDKETLMQITFLRDYEPTACLIWTPSGIVVVA